MHTKCSPTWKVTLEHESNRDPTGTTRDGGGLRTADESIATENSNLTETQEFAAKWASAVDGPMLFHDVDVIDDRA